MTAVPSFREELISQIPALQLLRALGYTYLNPDQALAARGEKLSNVLLDDILAAQLRRLNRIRYKGQTYAFSEANIQEAIRRLKNEPYDGLVRTSEKIYDLLTLGISLPQTIDGDTRSFTLQYIDWKRPANNVFHVSDEFSVERRRSSETRRPDIVLFVNGIPLVVIECKRPDLEKGGDKAVTEAITQMIRNQKDDEIPGLFVFAQLLMAVSKNDARYATTGTPKKFWSVWAEERDIEAQVHRLINRPMTRAEKNQLYNHREQAQAIRHYFDELEPAVLLQNGDPKRSEQHICSHYDASLQLLEQGDKTCPIKRLMVMQDGPNFFHHGRSNHLQGLLPRVSNSQEPLERLPRFGGITVTNLVFNYLQDRYFQVRIKGCSLVVRVINSSGLSARSTVLLSFISHFL